MIANTSGVFAGSFSRTAVNFSAGCETVVSNIVMVITVIISLEALTRLLYFTPIAILASIIISALPGLIDVHEAYKIYKVDKLDFLALTGAFFGVLFGSVEIGLLVAVTSSYTWIKELFTHTCMYTCVISSPFMILDNLKVQNMLTGST